jgi:predicted Rossmann fold nucleotide-binding protein DprA/Smf involved in DNA uptake
MTKPSNLLRVSGIVRDGVPLWAILRAFEDVRAMGVEVQSVVIPDAAPAPVPLIAHEASSPTKAPNMTAVLAAMKPGEATAAKDICGRTLLTLKQTHMALYNLSKAGMVKRVKPGEYVKVAT